MRRKSMNPLIPFGVLCAALAGCASNDTGRDGPGAGDVGPFPTLDARSVSDGLSVRSQGGTAGQREAGALPAESAAAGAPRVMTVQPEREAVPGAEASVFFSFTGNPPQVILVKVPGATDLFRIPLGSPEARAKNTGGRFDLTHPATLPVGRYCLDYVLVDADQRASNTAQACFRRPSDAGFIDAVQPRLTANSWVGGCERFGSNFSGRGRFTFARGSVDGGTMREEFAEFNNPNCSGTPTNTEIVQYRYTIGIEEVSGDGTRVNQFDYEVFSSSNPQESPIGATFFDIIFVGNGQLLFGFEDPERRPQDPAQRPGRLNPQTRLVPGN